MKTIEPKDWSKTPDQYLIDSRMGMDAQKKYMRTAIAYLVIFGFSIWAAGWCIDYLYTTYQKSEQGEQK